MAMTALNPELWKSNVQDYLNNMLIADRVCTMDNTAASFGDTIDFPYTEDVISESYTPGSDITGQATAATQSALSINQSEVVSVTIDYTQQKQAKANFAVAYQRQAAYRLKNEIDQYCINAGVTNAANTATTGTLDASSIADAFYDAETELFRSNATDGPLFAIMGAKHKNLLAKNFVANGFAKADSTLENSYVGQAYNFDCYASNNVPSTCRVTLGSNTAMADDTVTIAGVTFTFKAAPAAAGEVDVGADAAGSLANLVVAINGGAGAGSDYIALSTADRNKLTNLGVSASTASGYTDVTGFGYLGVAGVFTTTASNYVGTETTTILFGRKGAISLALQKTPGVSIVPDPDQLADKVRTWTLYGADVFERDKERLYALTCNA